MAGGIGAVAADTLLDLVYGGTAWSPPTSLYVALFSAAPSNAGGGIELTGNGYARAVVPNDVAHWPAASGGVKTNGQTVTFPAPTADWAAAVAAAVFTLATGGTLLHWGPLETPVAALSGSAPFFSPGELSLSLTGTA